jgi:hypothetical protein
VIELLIARVFCRSAFGSDHVLAAGVDAGLGPLLVLVDEAPELRLSLLLPPQPAARTTAATARSAASEVRLSRFIV